MAEVWKSIVGYEGLYEVSDYGNVKSLERMVSRGIGERTVRECILKPRLTGSGNQQRQYVNLCKEGEMKNRAIHRIVAEAFIGQRPAVLVTDHLDNNPFNNRADNLQYITQRLNASKDKKNCSSKFTGVCWDKHANKWKAIIHIDGKSRSLGYFDDELQAAFAYQIALTEHEFRNKS